MWEAKKKNVSLVELLDILSETKGPSGTLSLNAEFFINALK